MSDGATDDDLRTILRITFVDYGIDLKDPNRGQLGLEHAIMCAMRHAYGVGLSDGQMLSACSATTNKG